MSPTITKTTEVLSLLYSPHYQQSTMTCFTHCTTKGLYDPEKVNDLKILLIRIGGDVIFNFKYKPFYFYYFTVFLNYKHFYGQLIPRYISWLYSSLSKKHRFRILLIEIYNLNDHSMLKYSNIHVTTMEIISIEVKCKSLSC